jgi:quercetin dioxygenase-like cupin family protein
MPIEPDRCRRRVVISIAADRSRAHPHPHPEWFSGPVHIEELRGGSETRDLEIFAVYFDAGARTLPHTHSTDQLLYFLEGEGVVGTEGGARRYRPGGMAVIPADRWHWHGATPTSATVHLSIRPGGPSVWAPEVPMLDWDAYMDRVIETT